MAYKCKKKNAQKMQKKKVKAYPYPYSVSIFAHGSAVAAGGFSQLRDSPLEEVVFGSGSGGLAAGVISRRDAKPPTGPLPCLSRSGSVCAGQTYC